jgi:hypothetical protein
MNDSIRWAWIGATASSDPTDVKLQAMCLALMSLGELSLGNTIEVGRNVDPLWDAIDGIARLLKEQAACKEILLEVVAQITTWSERLAELQRVRGKKAAAGRKLKCARRMTVVHTIAEEARKNFKGSIPKLARQIHPYVNEQLRKAGQAPIKQGTIESYLRKQPRSAQRSG